MFLKLLLVGFFLCNMSILVEAYVEVEWFAPFFSGGGYCTEAISMLSAIKTQNSTVFGVKAYHHGDSVNNKFVDSLTQKEKKAISNKNLGFAKNPDFVINVCHSEPGAWHAPNPNYFTNQCPSTHANYKIGRSMFETDTLPSGWTSRLNYMDEVWVPTSFSKEVFRKGGVDPTKLFVVGEAVDTDFFSPVVADTLLASGSLGMLRELHQLSKDFFIFLFVGKWEERKGIKLLLSSYFQEFQHNEKVLLAIVTSAYHSPADFNFQILSIIEDEDLPEENPPEWRLLQSIPQHLMPALYRLADVLVIPSHGEGWGRPHVEAMSVGTPIIATHWSGPTEYLTISNGYPLRSRGLIPAG